MRFLALKRVAFDSDRQGFPGLSLSDSPPFENPPARADSAKSPQAVDMMTLPGPNAP